MKTALKIVFVGTIIGFFLYFAQFELYTPTVVVKETPQEIFDKMQNVLPAEFGGMFKLRIIESPELNASVDMGGNIEVTTGMIDLLGDHPGAFAAVLGHEMGHYVMEHLKLQARDSDEDYAVLSPWRETLADNMGLVLAAKAGYNGCEVEFFWKTMSSRHGDRMFPTTHPTNLFRLENIHSICVGFGKAS